MNSIEKTAIDYFVSSPYYFWRWSENGEAVEWKDGETICYTDDLLNILRGLTDIGLPPLGTVLLLLAACQHREDKINLEAHVRRLAEVSHTQFGRTFRIYPLARTMLRQIGEVPADLRTGAARIHLIREILDNEGTRARAIQVPPDQVRAVLDEFSSGRIDQAVFRERPAPTGQFLLIEIIPLAFACRKFPDLASLERHLRSGLSEAPPPAELPLPEPESPDLLDELEKDPQTLGLARLSRRLLAALNIPMHARGASDLPIGGVADISNRGDFDRLLLSELAHDDHTLTARLVNNEALFLRREEPPANLDRQRIILVDTTLKMWGVQRMFALSAALAVARNNHHVTAVRAFTLDGHNAVEANLGSKTGILDAMSRLDSALHCGDALTRFFAKTPPAEQEDYVLISDTDAMRGEKFQASLAAVRERLRFLIVLHRDGSLEFYEFIQGRGKLIGKSKFDLEALLFAPSKSKESPPVREGRLPAFFLQKPYPLYFPLTAVQLNTRNTFFDPDRGVAVVTNQQRVLYWPDKYRGGLELAPFIEPGQCHGGFGKWGDLFILVQAADGQNLYLYKFDRTGRLTQTRFDKGFEGVSAIAFDDGWFYVFLKTGYIQMIDAANERIADLDPSWEYASKNDSRRKSAMNFTAITQYIRRNYSTIQRAKSIFITGSGELAVDSHYLRVLDGDRMKWTPGVVPEPVELDTSVLVENPFCVLYARSWPNGSQAIVDARGLLHLTPADSREPEVTIVLIADTMTAAWASDGTACGNEGFLNVPAGQCMPVADFYHQYIKPFINNVVNVF